MGPYDFNLVPKEGEVPEEDAPLLVDSASASLTSQKEDGAGEGVDDETPIGPDKAFSSPGERIARARKRNQKTYNVLSIEEARIINKFARNTFLFKVFLITLVALVALLLPE